VVVLVLLAYINVQYLHPSSLRCPPATPQVCTATTPNDENGIENGVTSAAFNLTQRLRELEEREQRVALLLAGYEGKNSGPKIPCPHPTCSGHGKCDNTKGKCHCDKGFINKYCDLSTSSYRDLTELVTALFPLAGSHQKGAVAAFRALHPKAKVLTDDVEEGKSARGLAATLNGLLQSVTTPFTLVAVDLRGWYPESSLAKSVEMLLETGVDILGGLTVNAPGNVLVSPCYELVHKRWTLKHRRSPYGYKRHERFVMYCDRTSNTFVARTSVLRDTLKGWNATMSNIAITDLFVRIKAHNEELQRNTKDRLLREKIPTRIQGTILVGTHAEVLYLTTVQSPEVFDAAFAYTHAVEALWYPNGTRSQVICIDHKHGVAGHSKRGLYSPYCHRLQRQRDFVYLANLWLDSKWNSPKESIKYGISVHHGNLFGALRFGTELLWETDGDFDMIAFGASHEELLTRWSELQGQAKKDGFIVKTKDPQKPWYTTFARDRTDFQLNARSTTDRLTRGKPPQIHNLSLAYQGYLVHVNGFQNPWEGIQLDPGHDYREQFLAMQGWVTGFTTASIACKEPGHNACLPECNDPFHLLDHSYCTDEVSPMLRDPGLPEPHTELWKQQLQEFL